MIVNSDKIHVLFNRQKKTGSQEWGSQNKRTNHKAVFPVELLDLEIDDKLSFHLLVGIVNFLYGIAGKIYFTILRKNYPQECKLRLPPTVHET